jgi:endonuclease/exonuclease/phosphatase (EEP) superfamily protein YafD
MIVTYNRHLESKGDDRLRCSQLEETLGDSRQYNARTPILLVGDFKLDASDGSVASAISRAQFQDAFRNQHVRTTPDSLFADGRTIDWVFSRGPVQSSQPQVHRSVSASDHYPLSVSFDFA